MSQKLHHRIVLIGSQSVINNFRSRYLAITDAEMGPAEPFSFNRVVSNPHAIVQVESAHPEHSPEWYVDRASSRMAASVRDQWELDHWGAIGDAARGKVYVHTNDNQRFRLAIEFETSGPFPSAVSNALNEQVSAQHGAGAFIQWQSTANLNEPMETQSASGSRNLSRLAA